MSNLSQEEKEAIEQEFQIALDNIVSKIKGETATAIVYSEQPMILLFRKLMFKLEQEKEKNKNLEEYANWHIEHLTEDIADCIDDNRKANASLIGELKENREHWKDIVRINNNQITYIDYKNY